MKFPGIPFSFILVIIVFIIFDIFLRKTALGRQIYCVGGNPRRRVCPVSLQKRADLRLHPVGFFMAGMAVSCLLAVWLPANSNAGFHL